MTVIGIQDLRASNAPTAGSKGANLGELASTGVPVPGGFVVTTGTFQDFFQANALKDTLTKFTDALDYDDPKRLHFIAGRIRQIMGATPWVGGAPKAMRNEANPFKRYAVRSSAIGEDGEATSFAGQHSTFLNVEISDISNRVKQCFASLFEPRALTYRHEQGLPLETAQMAVVVQEMVRAQVSGVMFTRDPNTGESRTVIEAVKGLGEALVSGAVTPDHYEVENGVIMVEERHPQATYLDGGLGEWKPVRTYRQDDLKLTHFQVYDLVALGAQIEAHYKAPQDIEWAIDEGGDIQILQTRPITTTGKTKAAALDRPIIAKGASACFGMATGPVRLITSVGALDQVKDGDILVTSMTNPDFVPVFKKLAGLITDLGGATCHAAIISREFNLPCVVGTSVATAVLNDGDIVTVDGGNGLVYRG